MQQLYNVTVPPGVHAGQQFQAQIGPQAMLITCPVGAGPGSVVRVAGAPAAAAPLPMAVAVAQPAYAATYPPPQPAYAAAQPAYTSSMPAYGQPTYGQPANGAAPQAMHAGYAPSPPAAYPVAPQAKQMYAAPAYAGKVPPPVHMQPTHAMQLPAKLERLYLGLGWQSPRHGLDLDASVVCFSRGRQVDLINFQKLRNVAQGQASIVHTGDVLSGQQGGGKAIDLERIYLLVPQLREIDAIFLVVNVFTDGATFSDVSSAYCRLVNADSDQELGRFELTSLKGNAVIFARVERHLHGHWQWVALGTSASGRTAHEVASFIGSSPAMVAKPTTFESVAGHGGPGVKPTTQKPTKSWVAPALIAGTAAGVAAAALIFTQPQLTQSMVQGASAANPTQYMDLSNISMPDLPIDIDLTPPAEVAAAFGDFAGSAAQAGGAFVQGAGSVGGSIVDSATAMASGIDLSPVGSALAPAGAFFSQVGATAGQGAQSAFTAVGDSGAASAVGNGVDGVMGAATNTAQGGCDDCGDCDGGCLGSLGVNL
ncbi:hypothetical protein KFE25_007984 [Diacronema lutheri]|uniref:TerD domain-containing protein n=2 Tax=Diacronema lutheri TaxID=2081491 RepID=A0A8J5XRJ0_DIALT|nr:hypothetical protein KFE25_007984 [Diacronema lutheri]